MGITITATFFAPPVLKAPEGRASDPSSAEASSIGVDFAAVLLGLPDNMAPADGEKARVEVSPPLTDPLFLTVVAPNPPTQTLTAPQSPLDRTGASSVSALSTGRPNTLERELRSHPTGEHWSAAPTALRLDHKAAKFAAATPGAADLLPRAEPRPAEPQLSAASSLATIAPGTHTPVSGASAATAQEMPLGVQTSLRDPSWAGELGQKLLWFAGNDKQFAQLTLNPPQLGSIEITLNIDKDSANAHFVSANADVRAAIETALPRLREMFAGTGIMLGQVSVGSESFPQSSDGQHELSRQPRRTAENAILGIDTSGGPIGQAIATHRGTALIDIFA